MPFRTEGRCKFTHALEELRPTPESWTTIKGHYWEQGTPLPDQDVLDLIEQYVEISSAWELPAWVRDLRAHREEAKQEEEGGPWRRAHREEAEQEEQQDEEARQVAEEEQEVDQGGTGQKVAVAEEEQEADQGGTGQKVAEPAHDAHMALLVPAMKAILGYTELTCPTPDDLSIGGMLLKDMRIAFCLCGRRSCGTLTGC